MSDRERAYCDGWIAGLIAATALKLGQYDRWDKMASEYYAMLSAHTDSQ